ncbi:MAG: ubiquitin [Oscillospiraceae bacterium]|nr:ubiquitin [Oscillospiraceae bacterium]
MAVTLDQVERLREKASVSYEDARWALEQSGGDLLAALILLEQAGKISGGNGGAYATKQGAQPEVHHAPATRQEQTDAGKEQAAGSLWRQLWARTKDLLKKSAWMLLYTFRCQFDVYWRGAVLTSLPLVVVIILVLAFFWITVPILLCAALIGCRYRISAYGAYRESVRRAFDALKESMCAWTDQLQVCITGQKRART